MKHDEVEEVVGATVKRIFTGLGVDIDNADEIRHFQANMAFLFRWRRISEKVGMAIIVTIFTLLTGGLLKLVWDVVKSKGTG